MAESSSKKKVVKVDSPKGGSGGSGASGPVWTPTPEAKSKATAHRIMAALLWFVAIAIEAVAIWVVLPKVTEGAWQWWWLLLILIPIAACAIIANLSWKKANRLDPASKKDTVRFFIQNQLGAFITVIAFLPLIIVVLLNKDIDGKQKSIVSIVAALVMLGAAATGVSWDGGPSQEQYAEEENIIVQLTGADEVYWVKGGSVFHVCDSVPDVNKESKDGQIYTGTVADAHEAGKSRLTLKWESEAVNYCGYTQEQVDQVKAGLPAADNASDGTADSGEGTDPGTDASTDTGADTSAATEEGGN